MTHLPAAFRTVPLAHRALHDLGAGRPENSRAAIRAAIAAGYGIEIDLQLSADDQAMVFHDYDLRRLTLESGLVRQRTAADLRHIALKGSPEGIPTLTDVLDLVAGRVAVLIEIKDQDGALGAAVGPLERAAAAALKGYGGPVALMSFNPHSVAACADFAPDVPRGLTTEKFSPWTWKTLPRALLDTLRRIADYDRVGASFISHQHSDLRRPRVAEIKQAGGAVLCWTIRSPREETAARRVADNITFEGYAAALPPA